MLGFIFTRHVNSQESNKFWNECYRCIRLFYPNNHIIIIDDNSDYSFVKCDVNLTNFTIIQSEFPGAGELLCYYYFYKTRIFSQAFIIHDSVFINKFMNVDSINTVKFLWDFVHDWDDSVKEKNLISTLKNNAHLLELYDNKNEWRGCFGVQSVITLDFIDLLVEKYDIFSLLNIINSRPIRYLVERVFAVLCCAEEPILKQHPSIFGDIHNYLSSFELSFYGCGYKDYIFHKQTGHFRNLPLIKTWAFR
jgi:hypothetical protein